MKFLSLSSFPFLWLFSPDTWLDYISQPPLQWRHSLETVLPNGMWAEVMCIKTSYRQFSTLFPIYHLEVRNFEIFEAKDRRNQDFWITVWQTTCQSISFRGARTHFCCVQPLKYGNITTSITFPDGLSFINVYCVISVCLGDQFSGPKLNGSSEKCCRILRNGDIQVQGGK